MDNNDLLEVIVDQLSSIKTSLSSISGYLTDSDNNFEIRYNLEKIVRILVKKNGDVDMEDFLGD